jgi:hypothetical protein
MNYSLCINNTRTTADRLLDRELAIERLRYELNAPLWYWTPQEVAMLEYQLDKELLARSRVAKDYDSNDYPSCIIDKWWLY